MKAWIDLKREYIIDQIATLKRRLSLIEEDLSAVRVGLLNEGKLEDLSQKKAALEERLSLFYQDLSECYEPSKG